MSKGRRMEFSDKLKNLLDMDDEKTSTSVNYTPRVADTSLEDLTISLSEDKPKERKKKSFFQKVAEFFTEDGD